MATTPDLQNVQQEGRLLAIRAIKTKQSRSVRAAADSYDVPRTTLSRRPRGSTTQRESQRTNRKLTPTEESTLVQWILSMDQRGLPLRAPHIRRMAQILLDERVGPVSTTVQPIGECWVRNFINRHGQLESKYHRKYDYRRAQCEDLETVRNWFRLVQNTIAKYGITCEDTYNFDEIGFQMGVIATAKVVTGSERVGRPVMTQPGNREWVTAIEAINTYGRALPPMVIFAGKVHQSV